MLKSAIIAGLKIDPKKQDFFKLLIEERQRNAGKKDVLKTIANSTSYGIFIEINPENEKSKINAYGLEKITTNVNKIESLGYYFNPIVAIFITSAAKLVLACTETILNSHGTVHAFCDTDSMAVPKEYHKEIQDFFRSLNPYDFDKPLFKIEKENFGSDGQLKDLWFYGISAKRYVLYNMENNKIIIRKHSSHGLGHILNPFDKKINWEEEFWMDILKEHYGMISKDELRSKYSSFYAISKITVSNANILKRLSKINKNQPLEKQIKPFNFVLIGFGMKLNDKQTDIIKPLAPFCSSPQEIAYRDFIDYKSGRTHNGLEYWKPMDIVFFDYIHHKEAKSDGNVGILQRKSVICDQITYIGKESTSLDTTGIIDKPNYVEYVSNNPYAYKLLQMTPKDVKRYGIARNTLWYMKKRAKSGKFRVSKRVERGLFRAMEVK
jgi:hypothetical protein